MGLQFGSQSIVLINLSCGGCANLPAIPRSLSMRYIGWTGPSAVGQDVDIPLPSGLAVRNMERKWQAEGNLPQPWSLAGALSVLRDSAVATLPGEEKADAGKATGARALVIFSTGAEGTSITPEDLAGQAVAASVPIYPVALPGFPWVLPYEGYTYRGPYEGWFLCVWRSGGRCRRWQ